MAPSTHRIYDFRAAVAALKYLNEKSITPNTILRACKLLYFAEKDQ